MAWLAVAAAVVVLNGWVVAPFLVGGGPAIAGDGKRDLRVMTLNVHFSTTDYESTLRLLREQRPTSWCSARSTPRGSTGCAA